MTDERKRRIMDILIQKEEEITVRPVEIMKNNCVSRQGICISRKGENSGPVVYWDDILDGCGEEHADEEIADGILRIAMKYVGNRPDCLSLSDWENCKTRVFPKLINADRNRERLERLMHREYLDLAEVYYLKIQLDDVHWGTAEVTKEIFERWGIDQETLKRQSAENMRKQGYRMTSLEEILQGTLGPMGDVLFRGSSMRIIMNTDNAFGAAILANPELLKEVLGEEIGDCYILPSSTHELIVCPKDEWTEAGCLRETVMEVNRDVVSGEDYLSDEVYFYDANFVEIRRAEGEKKYSC